MNSQFCSTIAASGENKLYLRHRLLFGWHSGRAQWNKWNFHFVFAIVHRESNHKNMFWKLLQFHKWHSLERSLFVRSICIHIVHRASYKFPMNSFSNLILLFRLHEVRVSAAAITAVLYGKNE